MKMRKDWKKKNRMKRRKWTTEEGGETVAPWKVPLRNVVYVYMKLFPTGQSTLRQESLRTSK